MGSNTPSSQTLDQHPGDIHTGQILVAVMTMMVVEVVAADNHELGETLATIQTQMTIQVWTITWKRIEKGIALPLVAPLHQLDMSGWDPNPKHI
jgi:hypothetical protein